MSKMAHSRPSTGMVDAAAQGPGPGCRVGGEEVRLSARTLLARGALEHVALVGAAGDQAVHLDLPGLPDAVAARHRLQVVLRHSMQITTQVSSPPSSLFCSTACKITTQVS
jgi:hypothetical protein